MMSRQVAYSILGLVLVVLLAVALMNVQQNSHSIREDTMATLNVAKTTSRLALTLTAAP